MAAGAKRVLEQSGRVSIDMTRYDMEAEREAMDSGMAIHELRGVLNGEPITTLVPPMPTENVVAYGVRATGEILVRYLVDDPSIPTRTE